jgi:hypothetical protein
MKKILKRFPNRKNIFKNSGGGIILSKASGSLPLD